MRVAWTVAVVNTILLSSDAFAAGRVEHTFSADESVVAVGPDAAAVAGCGTRYRRHSAAAIVKITGLA